MSDLASAIKLICKYEGFNETAYPDINTGGKPYTIGFGTQYYSDGSPVKAGQKCTKQKAYEYLFNEISIIQEQIKALDLKNLNNSIEEALISFIHSVGWEAFLYSNIIDCLEIENYAGASQEISKWIFNEKYEVIGNLLDRRKEEINLFLNEIEIDSEPISDILLTAFHNFEGNPNQLRAIRKLENRINPYVLSDFTNEFRMNTKKEIDYSEFDISWSL